MDFKGLTEQEVKDKVRDKVNKNFRVQIGLHIVAASCMLIAIILAIVFTATGAIICGADTLFMVAVDGFILGIHCVFIKLKVYRHLGDEDYDFEMGSSGANKYIESLK